MKFNITTLLIISLNFLASCTSNVQQRTELSDQVAINNSFKKELVKSDNFLITTYQKIQDHTQPIVFYIEGDGLPQKGGFLTDNPTPIKQMLIKLAVLDKRPNVVYVGRLCQYTPMELNPKCKQNYWGSERFSIETVNVINDIIAKISQNKPYSLIGFSGGGTIATLIAAQDKNVKDIITLAGNLDTDEFLKLQGLPGYFINSINPVKIAGKINHIPQLHISGGADSRVPKIILDNYLAASGSSTCVQSKIYSGIAHQGAWYKIWQEILAISLTCK